MKPELLNGANLAYIGDAYFELFIREYLINKQITNQKELHKLSVSYVSASAHQKIITKLEQELTEEEMIIFKRGRNHKYHLSRKNVKLDEYLNSSGFEALIGYLYLKKDLDRLKFITNKAITIIEDKNE
ncbi:MAG: Mini-ribonuclease 3 [Bacilli bacterium]